MRSVQFPIWKEEEGGRRGRTRRGGTAYVIHMEDMFRISVPLLEEGNVPVTL